MHKSWFMFLIASLSFSLQISAAPSPESVSSTSEEIQTAELPNVMDELDPFDPNIEQTLEQIDQDYEQETGMRSHVDEAFDFRTLGVLREQITCVRQECDVWAQVVRSTQTLYLYLHGELAATWKVSTGIPGRGTPDMDRHPDGRIYDRYTSVKFPGGDYNGLGNMPYAVFIYGGFAIHGTAQSNWKRLGSKASHGCIRVHPDNAFYFNRLVRQTGIKNVWVTVQE